MAPQSYRIGVLLLPGVQLLDFSCIDLFGMLTPEYLNATPLPQPLKDLAVSVDIKYITQTGSSKLAELTANIEIRIDCDLEAEAVQPSKLDLLLIPGPDPRRKNTKEENEFIQRHSKEKNTTIMTVCTGVTAAGQAGILTGKRVSLLRGLEEQLNKDFPGVIWEDRRWSVDGNLWSSGGITNGLDMTAAFLRKKWPGPLSELVCNFADVGDRTQDYAKSKPRNMLTWVWIILRAWWQGGAKDEDKKA